MKVRVLYLLQRYVCESCSCLESLYNLISAFAQGIFTSDLLYKVVYNAVGLHYIVVVVEFLFPLWLPWLGIGKILVLHQLQSGQKVGLGEIFILFLFYDMLYSSHYIVMSPLVTVAVAWCNAVLQFHAVCNHVEWAPWQTRIGIASHWQQVAAGHQKNGKRWYW